MATDLKRMQRFYGHPSDQRISEFENEIIAFLKNGYLDTVYYGFQRNGNWIAPTLKYSARDLYGSSVVNDDPGRLVLSADISGAIFHSYLQYSGAWSDASAAEREAFNKLLPFLRINAPRPGINGYLYDDRTYSAGGRALERASVRSLV